MSWDVDVRHSGPILTRVTLNHFFQVDVHLRTTPRGAGPTDQCLALFAAVLAGWFVGFARTVQTGSLLFAALTGMAGALLAGFGHNWAHQPRYHGWAWVLDLEGLSSQNWFVAHVLTHHMYTNLPGDNHFRILEPFLVTDPTKPRAWAQVCSPDFPSVVSRLASVSMTRCHASVVSEILTLCIGAGVRHAVADAARLRHRDLCRVLIRRGRRCHSARPRSGLY